MLSQDSDWSRKYLNNQGPSGMNSNFQPSFLSLFCAAYRYFEIHISVSNLDMEYVFVVNNQLLLDKKNVLFFISHEGFCKGQAEISDDGVCLLFCPSSHNNLMIW